jgi:riboflavin synthase
MFSGIVGSLGNIVEMIPTGLGYRLWISSSLRVAPVGEAGIGTSDRERIGLGDSIACNGVCLTVDKLAPPEGFSVVCGLETWKTTALSQLQVGSSLNLERALLVGDRLDGHIVQGHVDGVAVVRSNRKESESWVLWIDLPDELLRYSAQKGSITINGVSLTINELEGNALRVNIVPYTAEETTLFQLRSGMQVNIEVDVLARYVERLLFGGSESKSKLSFSKLQEMGYTAWPKGG